MRLMFYTFRVISTSAGRGQPLAGRLQRLVGPGLLLIALALVASSCHRRLRPWDADPRLPAAFRSPQATFDTWIAASLDGDRGRLRRCYWQGLSRTELAAWLERNLDPRTRALLDGARWQGLRPASPVEINFRFRTSDGTACQGVMVRTAGGWKLQSW